LIYLLINDLLSRNGCKVSENPFKHSVFDDQTAKISIIIFSEKHLKYFCNRLEWYK